MASDSLMSGGEKSSVPKVRKFPARSEDAAIILAPSGDIEQAEQNALGADADGIVEVSGNAFSGENGGNIRALDLGKDRRDGLDRGAVRRVRERKRERMEMAQSETSTGSGSRANRRFAQSHWQGTIARRVRMIAKDYSPYLSARYLARSDSSWP